MHNYIINHNINFNCGFPLSTNNVVNAIHNTNDVLEKLPALVLCQDLVQVKMRNFSPF